MKNWTWNNRYLRLGILLPLTRVDGSCSMYALTASSSSSLRLPSADSGRGGMEGGSVSSRLSFDGYLASSGTFLQKCKVFILFFTFFFKDLQNREVCSTYDFGSSEQRFGRAGCPEGRGRGGNRRRSGSVALIVVRLIERDPVVGARQEARLDKGTQVGHLAPFRSRSCRRSTTSAVRSSVIFASAPAHTTARWRRRWRWCYNDSCSDNRFACWATDGIVSWRERKENEKERTKLSCFSSSSFSSSRTSSSSFSRLSVGKVKEEGLSCVSKSARKSPHVRGRERVYGRRDYMAQGKH